MAKIKATRNGTTREFHQSQWNAMPNDKYGWQYLGVVDGDTEAVKPVKEIPTSPGIGMNFPEVNEQPPVNDAAKNVDSGENADIDVNEKFKSEVLALNAEGRTRAEICKALGGVHWKKVQIVLDGIGK